MKAIFKRENLIKYLLIVSIITVAIIGLYVIKQLFPTLLERIGSASRMIFIPFVLAFFFSFVVGPLSIKIKKTFRLPKSLSIFIAIFIAILTVIMILSITVVFIISQLGDIVSSLLLLVDNATFESILTEILNLINSNLDQQNMSELVNQFMNDGVTIERVFRLVGTSFVTITQIASSFIGTLFIIVLTPVFMYFMIKEKELLFRNLAKIIPKKFRPHAVELGIRSNIVIKNYFIGQGIIIITTFAYFVLAYGVLSFFIPNFSIVYAIIFAVLMGLLCVVPYLGIWLGMTAPIVYLTTLHLQYGSVDNTDIYLIGIIIVLLSNFLQNIIESSIVEPFVYSRQIHIHPLAVLSSLLFFGGVFGLPGVLLAIPIAGTLKVILQYYKEEGERTPTRSFVEHKLEEIEEEKEQEMKQN